MIAAGLPSFAFAHPPFAKVAMLGPGGAKDDLRLFLITDLSSSSLSLFLPVIIDRSVAAVALSAPFADAPVLLVFLLPPTRLLRSRLSPRNCDAADPTNTHTRILSLSLSSQQQTSRFLLLALPTSSCRASASPGTT
jgi:hypothetical protein